MKRRKGDTFERGGCLWIVDNVYTTDNPELYYKERITVRCMAGANAMTSMSEGITANAGIVYNSASALAPGITDSINTGLSTVDTSSTATTIGTNITNGVTTGIQTGTSNVVAAATEMVTRVQSTVEAGIAGI